jgi:hypothetical protein
MLIRWLISAIGLAALKDEASSIARRAGNRTIVVGLLAVVWLTASGFALGALAVWLSHELGVVAACAIIAAALAAVGVAIQLALTLRARRKLRDGVRAPFAGLTAGTDSARGAGGDLSSVAAVAIVGYLLGRQLFRS